MSIATLITTSLLEIATIEEKYYRIKLFSNSLSCPSKKIILESYYESLEDLLVIIGGFIQYNEITKETKSSLIDIHAIFKDKFSKILYKKEKISSKIVIMFTILLNYYENIIFDEILNCFDSKEDTIRKYEKILNLIFDLSEIAALTLSGIRLSCNNISDLILNEECCIYLKDHLLPSECENHCPFKNKGRDCLHLIVTNETTNIPRWADKILTVFEKYYTHPENLAIFIDYKLVDKYNWDDLKYKCFLKYKDIFGGYYFVNADNVNFGKWYSDVDIVPFEHLSSCISS